MLLVFRTPMIIVILMCQGFRMLELNCVSKRVKYSRSPQVGILPIVIQSNGVNNYLSFSICVSSYFSNFFAK